MAESTSAGRAATVAVKWLTPESAQLFEGTYSLLHCTVKGEALYRAVFAVRMFPITHPDRFVSLRYTDRDDKVHEIGVIEDIGHFPADAQDLIRRSLLRQCYERIIECVYEVKEQYGILFFWVRTQEGWGKFVTPWQGDRAEDYGANGKLILDAFDNRYVIPDLAALPQAERERVTTYIYW